jgi:hypothetical protein
VRCGGVRGGKLTLLVTQWEAALEWVGLEASARGCGVRVEVRRGGRAAIVDPSVPLGRVHVVQL